MHCTRALVRAEVSYIIICTLYDVGSTIKVVLNAFSCHIGVYRNSFRGDKLCTNVYNNKMYERLCTVKYTLYNNVHICLFFNMIILAYYFVYKFIIFYRNKRIKCVHRKPHYCGQKKNYNHFTVFTLFNNDNIKVIMDSIFSQ